MTDDTRLLLRRAPVPTPGEVPLVLGDDDAAPPAGVVLLLRRAPGATPGPVRLVFGDDGAAPPAIDDVTLTAAGRVTGLRGSVQLVFGADGAEPPAIADATLTAAGVITGLRGAVSLVFGEKEGVSLVFKRAPVPTPGAVPLLFGDDGAAPPAIADATLTAAGVITGLRGAIQLAFGEKEGVSLVFKCAPVPTPGPVRLVFGDDGAAPPAIDDATLTAAGRVTGLRGSIAVWASASVQASGRITGLRGALQLRVAVAVNAAGSITGLRLRIATVYNVNTARPTVGRVAAPYQQAQKAQAGVLGQYQQALPATSGARQHWQDARQINNMVRGAYQQAQALATLARGVYQQALPVPVVPLHSRWQESERFRTSARSGFQEAHKLPTVPLLQRFQEAHRVRGGGVQKFQEARSLQSAVLHWASYALQSGSMLGGRFQEARKPGCGVRPVPEPPKPPKCYDNSLPARLIFDALADSSLPARLIFKCEAAQPPGPDPEPGATIVVPVRRIYMTLNNITLQRADSGEPIPAYAFGMSIDVDSWTWQWSASLHPAALAQITPGLDGDPVAVLATINGAAYRLLVETYSRQRSFGQSRIAVSGRGRAAILDTPYAPVLNHGNSIARTAQQLMHDALTVNGVSIGWDIYWHMTDWLVPADTWAHQGSYISAILDIASAADGYVQPHKSEPILRILPRYPAAPWNWGTLTPDFELPSAVVSVEGIEWQRKALYDRMYVSGTTADGVLGQVTRAGMAGGNVAPMVTHPLITHADAARQRGIAVLGDTGRQAHISLKLPVLAETGVIQPGALVRYVDGGDTHLGLVRSTSVDWSRPTLRQTLSVETHPA